MGKIIEFNRRHIEKERIDQLYKEMSIILGDAEINETEDGGIILDPLSEIKVNELETKINLELLKHGYSVEEIYE